MRDGPPDLVKCDELQRRRWMLCEAVGLYGHALADEEAGTGMAVAALELVAGAMDSLRELEVDLHERAGAALAAPDPSRPVPVNWAGSVTP